jgi:DNA-directed RNA polymerase subunit RPC12/RpoP
VVRRYGFDIVEWGLGKGNRCPDCGYKVAIVGSPPRDSLKRPRFIPVRWELS